MLIHLPVVDVKLDFVIVVVVRAERKKIFINIYTTTVSIQDEAY